MSFLSVIVYESIFSHWKFRPVIAVTMVLSIFASMVDLVVIKRWNVTLLGISDKVFFMFGHTIVASTIASLRNIPITTIAAKLTPPEWNLFNHVIFI